MNKFYIVKIMILKCYRYRFWASVTGRYRFLANVANRSLLIVTYRYLTVRDHPLPFLTVRCKHIFDLVGVTKLNE